MHTLRIHVGAYPLSVEVARSLADKLKGLQGRSGLSEEQGMLFVFDPPERAGVGMQGVCFPLSVGFISPDGRLAAIVDLAAEQSEVCIAPVPVSAFLEVPQGWFARRGLTPGCQVSYVLAPRRMGFRGAD
jgi:uncharacterized membrane protein (UPF0127 family)